MLPIKNEIESLIKSVTLTRRDVLELTECIIQEYLDQQLKEIESEVNNVGAGAGESDGNFSRDPPVDVKCDEDGDYTDQEGYIYDIKSRIRIGEKNLKTKEKTMYNVV